MAPSVTFPADVAPEARCRPESLEAVYREHFSTTWRVLRRLGVPEAQLDDATQDVFLVVHRKLDAFDARSPLRSWIVAIAVRVASEYRRRGARRRTEQLDEAIPDAAPDPAQVSEMQESVRLLHEVLNTLDEKKRTVFVLAELEQLSVPEITQVLGVNLNTVYSRLRSARKEFEAALLERQRLRGRRPTEGER
jgi:RNA polymerase sigma-70 factor (ECF subfamily)